MALAPLSKKSAKKSEKKQPRPNPSKSISLVLSFGPEDGRSIEDAISDLRKLMAEHGTKLVTVTTNYYLVDGKVCDPKDYDLKTKDFKPGAHQPAWAGGPTPQPVIDRINKESSFPAGARSAINLPTVEELKYLKPLGKKRQETKAAKGKLVPLSQRKQAQPAEEEVSMRAVDAAADKAASTAVNHLRKRLAKRR